MSDRSEPTATLFRPLGRAPLGAVVRVEGARAKPSRLRLSRGSCVIGAGADVDVVIDDPTVSRRHVELELVPEGVAVRDLGSRNGTFVLGHRIERLTLSLGSRITVGAATLVVELDQESLDAPGDEVDGYRGLYGRAPPMRRLFATLARLEGSLVPVLVEGESGVGKELIARAIHAGSAREGRPFVVVNCGAIARELVLSDLFGHRKGAFTGAVEARRGAFEDADGGTLFLDEIGELPLEVQPALLRALEAGEIRAVGDTATRTVSVRVLAATNRDLTEEVRTGRFREDLFYRLAVVRLRVPPLRDRPEDVEALARRFAAAEGLAHLPDEAVRSFAARTWPGNVRELRNAVMAYVALGTLDPGGQTGDALEAALRRGIDPLRPFTAQKEELVARFSRLYLTMLLEHTKGNQSEAARIAELDRGHLGRMIAKLGVRGDGR